MDKQSDERQRGASALSDVGILQIGILCCALAMVVVFAVAVMAQ